MLDYDHIDIYEASDIHNENTLNEKRLKVGSTYTPFPHQDFNDQNRFKVLILAGDILRWSSTYQNVKWLTGVCENFDLVIYVFGNHEFHGAYLHGAVEKVREATSQITNLKILDNDVERLDLCGQKISFVGSTLWTDYDNDPEVMKRLGYYERYGDEHFIDFKEIKVNKKRAGQKAKPVDLLEVHEESKEFLFRSIDTEKALGRWVIVVTHHCPTYRAATRFSKVGWWNNYLSAPIENIDCVQFTDDEDEAAEWAAVPYHEDTPHYCSNLDKSIVSCGAHLWFFGHLHLSRHFYFGGTEFICNPADYHICRNSMFVSAPIKTIDIKKGSLVPSRTAKSKSIETE